MSAVPNPYLLSTTAIAAAGNYTEAFEHILHSDDPAYFAVIASSDQTGTVYVDQSEDGVNAIRSDSLAVGADAGPQGGYSATLKIEIVCDYIRARYVNGATLQTRFSIVRKLLGI